VTEGRKLAAILAADVVGYSRLAGVDEELILARLRTLRSDLIDPTIAVRGGRVVKRTGDGVLVEFRSVVDAVRCAIEMQLGMAERNAGLPPEKRIEYRIGVHIGDVVEESDGDLMGDGVNIAARLEGIAKPGAICLSEQAYWQVKGRLDLAVMDLGPTRLKNIAEPVHIYSLEAGAPARAKPLDGAARRKRSLIIALAAFIVALAAIGAEVWHFRWAGTHAERVAIMVLPFANLSGDSGQNQLAEGVTEGLTDAFSRLAASYRFFKVIAGDTAKAYADKPIDVKQIGTDLALRYLLRGSVQPAETQVRVSTQLIDAESGAQLWAETFDEDRAAPLQMEDEIVARIMRELGIRVADIEAERASTARQGNLGAAQVLAFRCAIGATNYEAVDPQKRPALLEPCDDALRLDPHNVLALDNRASQLLDGVDRGQSADREGDLKRAKDDVTTLLAMNADDSNAHALNAFRLRLEGQPAQAVADGERSVALNPDWVVAYFSLCPAYLDAGQLEKAIDCVDKAIRLSPHDPSLYGLFLTKAAALDVLGRDSEALDWVRRSIALAPEFQSAQRLEIAILEKLGRDDEARQAYQRYGARPGVAYSLCQSLLDADQPERAIDCVDKAIRLSLPDPALSELFRTKSLALGVLGRDSEALDSARRSLALAPENQMAQLVEITFLEILGRDAEAREAYQRYSARPETHVRTIADVRARAAPSSPALKAAFERGMEALRKAGMPEQ
jgi:class 3 adenylate cyclase/TolB-like protein/Flp pilus assembly protein TadD